MAQNVSGLARHFKGEKEKKPKAVNFMDALEKLVEKTIEDGQQVPVSAAMNMLLACGEVSPQDTNRILGRLVKSFDAVSLAGLVDRLNDVMTQRLDVERKAEVESADMAEAA